MAYAPGDIFEFTLKGDYNNVVGTRNVFHYRLVSATDMDDDAFASLGFAAESVWQSLLTLLTAVTSVIQGYGNMDAKVLTGDNAGLQNTYSHATTHGDISGDALPPQDCFTFRYQGTGGTHRNGYKRFSGIAESSQLDGSASGGILSDLADLADALRADVDILDHTTPTPLTIGILTPVIVKKVAGGLDPDDIVVIDSWSPAGVLYTHIGTQNSRKFGRGI